jgi:hypothetical protein
VTKERNGKGEFAQYCKDHSIKQLFARSYSPEANGIVERANKQISYSPNGIVERANKQIRAIMRAFFVCNNNNAWYNILDKIQDNKNNSFNESVKQMPNTIYDTSNKEVKTNVIAKSAKQVAKLFLLSKKPFDKSSNSKSKTHSKRMI